MKPILGLFALFVLTFSSSILANEMPVYKNSALTIPAVESDLGPATKNHIG